MTQPLAVLACGAVTPVGLSAMAAFAAMRAGVSAYEEAGFFQDTLPPKPHQVCQVPLRPLAGDEPRRQRLVEMAASAIDQCLDGVEALHCGKTALLLCVGEPFRERGRPHSESLEGLLDAIQERLGLRFHPLSRTIEEGNAGAIAALAVAHDLIATGRVQQCIVGGVDSFVNVRDLRRFEGVYRLKQEGVAQGFVPGEGAAFVRIGAVGSQDMAWILGVGIAREDKDATVLSDGHPTGHGLVRALQDAVRNGGIGESCVVFRVSDLNGEHYRGIESMMALSRTYRTRREDVPIWLPAVSVGEMGAAAGPMLVIMAVLGMSTRRAPGPVAMCESSSDQGLRAGCVVCAAGWTPEAVATGSPRAG